MQLIPAIDLIGGRCVRLFRGDYSKETIYPDDPVEVALRWQRLGASRIHIVDLDGARVGRPENLHVVERINNAVRVPVQMGGGIRTLSAARRVIAAGVSRVMLGTVAVQDPQIVRSACAEFGDEAIIVAIDSRNGFAAISGWTSDTRVPATDLILHMQDAGARTFLCTDISKDGTLAGPDYTLMRQLVEVAGQGVIAAGGIASIQHLKRLAQTGVAAAVIGKALYTGDIDLAQAINAIEGPDP